MLVRRSFPTFRWIWDKSDGSIPKHSPISTNPGQLIRVLFFLPSIFFAHSLRLSIAQQTSDLNKVTNLPISNLINYFRKCAEFGVDLSHSVANIRCSSSPNAYILFPIIILNKFPQHFPLAQSLSKWNHRPGVATELIFCVSCWMPLNELNEFGGMAGNCLTDNENQLNIKNKCG